MAEAQHNIDSVRLNRQWKEVTSEILLYHKYKEARRWWNRWYSFLLRAWLHGWHVYTDGADRGHCHILQPERIPWHVNSTTLLCQTSRSHRPNHCGNQTTLPQIRLPLKVFPTVSSGQLPCHLWNHWTVQRFLPSQIQHARKRVFNTQENQHYEGPMPPKEM